MEGSNKNLYFSIDNIRIKPADAHKHLGATLSADCKWFKHINNVVVKASIQIAVLHKICDSKSLI
jgi:hypothetical protein